MTFKVGDIVRCVKAYDKNISKNRLYRVVSLYNPTMTQNEEWFKINNNQGKADGYPMRYYFELAMDVSELQRELIS